MKKRNKIINRILARKSLAGIVSVPRHDPQGYQQYHSAIATCDRKPIDLLGPGPCCPGEQNRRAANSAARELNGVILSTQVHRDVFSLVFLLPMSVSPAEFMSLYYAKVNDPRGALSQRNKSRAWLDCHPGQAASGPFVGFMSRNYTMRTIYLETGELATSPELQFNQYHRRDLARARKARDHKKNIIRLRAQLSFTSRMSSPFTALWWLQ